MNALRFLVPLLAALHMVAAGGVSAQGVLVERSEIRFVSKQMGVNVEGRFRKWKADVDFRPGELAQSKANLEVELASIDLASEDVEAEARRAVWFDTARYPVAKFTSTGIRNLGGERYEIAGTLSIKGIAKTITVPVTLKRDAAGDRVAEGQLTIRRLDFRLGEGIWSDTDTVANDVTVRLRMVLTPP